MKSLLLIAAVLLTGALANSDGLTCVPGSVSKKECNTCRCSEDGMHLACTRRFCPPEEQSDDPKGHQTLEASDAVSDKDEEQVQTNGQVCTPNEVKMEDCNRCKCANNGIGWFCTRRACPPREKRQVTNSNEKPCVPGTRFKSADGCNDCFCSETGIVACTQKFCLAKTKRQVSKQECVPGTTFKSKDGCNDCTCSANGVAACTLRFCLSESDLNRPARSTDNEPLPKSAIAPGTEGFECTPGKAFKYQCNTCFCDSTGKQAGCTFLACPPGEY